MPRRPHSPCWGNLFQAKILTILYCCHAQHSSKCDFKLDRMEKHVMQHIITDRIKYVRCISLELTCVFLYSMSCERPKTVATAPPPTIAVCFRAFLNAMAPAGGKGKCSEELEPGDTVYARWGGRIQNTCGEGVERQRNAVYWCTTLEETFLTLS